MVKTILTSGDGIVTGMSGDMIERLNVKRQLGLKLTSGDGIVNGMSGDMIERLNVKRQLGMEVSV